MADSAAAREWLRYARSDLALAEAAPPTGVLLEHLCFHAQQAAEKAIEAVLVSLGDAPPKVHDLDYLLGLVRDRAGVPDDDDRVIVLTDYAVLTRYPADVGEVSEEEWREAVSLGQAVLAWAERAVEEAGAA